MMEAVKAGAGREDARAAIKEHALATVKDLREVDQGKRRTSSGTMLKSYEIKKNN